MSLERKRLWVILSFAAVMSVFFINLNTISDVSRFLLADKASIKISLQTAAPGITSLAADSENRLLLEVHAADTSGNPVPAAPVTLKEKNGIGSFNYIMKRTDRNGSLIVEYSPPEQSASLKSKSSADLTLTASLPGTTASAALPIKLVRVPVVFIHGYKASPTIFGNFMDALKAAGFSTFALDYDSGSGVAVGAVQLHDYLAGLESGFTKKGILVCRFDLIAHSMGGLVARYYTCSSEYPVENNVDKIIFVSVPQKGSPLASLGLRYYKDRGIYDLMPDSELQTKSFPGLLNKGLNEKIRCASILGQYDEVVSMESASLEDWGIGTEVFSVGENNFTVDKLLTGKIVEATNHKLVLDNSKIYKRVVNMLLSELPFPKKQK